MVVCLPLPLYHICKSIIVHPEATWEGCGLNSCLLQQDQYTKPSGVQSSADDVRRQKDPHQSGASNMKLDAGGLI